MKKIKMPTHREVIILGILTPGERYGREIRVEYERDAGRSMPLGSLYVTLDRMEKAGFVKSRIGESGHHRGGNRRKYFELTGHGYRMLKAVEVALLGSAARETMI